MTADPTGPDADAAETIMIRNKRGLHARAAAKFVRLVEGFEAEVWVTKDGETVSGRSIMGLMMLGAGPGTSIDVAASGGDAAAALEAIRTMVEAKFDED